MKTLIIFYSLSGNTRFIAQILCEAIGAEMLELRLVEPVPQNGFRKYFRGGRQVFTQQKPALLPLEKSAQDYDLLIFGTPVWAWSYAPALATFFSQVRIQGKKIALFCCSGGGKGKTLEKMKEELVGNEFVGAADFVEPLRAKEKNAGKAKAWIADVVASR